MKKIIELKPRQYDIIKVSNSLDTQLLSSKKIYWLSFLLGCILTLCFSPISILPLIIVTFSGLFYLTTQYKTRKEAFFSGWLFGLGHFLTSLHWFAAALLAQAEQFAWLIPFALTLIPGVLALFTGCFTLLVSYFTSSKSLKYIAFCLLWVMFEIIRGYFFIPFPWNYVAYTISDWNNLMQISYYIGIHLVSLLIIITSGLLYKITWQRLASILIITGLVYSIGSYRLYNAIPEFEDVMLRIAQPNITEHHMGRPQYQEIAINTLINLSITKPNNKVRAIIWPESGFPYLFASDSKYLKSRHLESLALLAPKDGYLVIGADRVNSKNEVYNSIMVIDNNGKQISEYDKEILVPFGEYVPLRRFIPIVDKVAYGIGEFSKGINNKQYNNKDILLNFVPLICYEVIFPLNDHDQKAAWMLNITNDGWFGKSLGPYQHFAMAKFKAVEYGIPLVRAANTGISALINPYGTILSLINLGEKNIVDFLLPKRIKMNNMIIKSHAILLIFLAFIICSIIEIVLKHQKKKMNNEQKPIKSSCLL